MVKIKKISREMYDGDVFDLSIKNSKAPFYYVNRILTHNSLYPHILMQCNLFGRNKTENIGWHGGDMWAGAFPKKWNVPGRS